MHYYKKYFPLVEEQCKNITSILDIGCGTGHLLERFGIYPDLKRVGIELNVDRANMARMKAGCDIFQIPLEEFSSKEKFDVITMMNVLSHIPSFDNLFHAVQSLLNENGKFILKLGEYAKDVNKNDVFDWEIPDHMHFLGMKTIDYICSKYNFDKVKSQRIKHSEELFSVERWKTPGRSANRDIAKKFIASIPFALPLLAKCYNTMHGEKVYSSFIVLSRKK